jgi:hypothetical protein
VLVIEWMPWTPIYMSSTVWYKQLHAVSRTVTYQCSFPLVDGFMQISHLQLAPSLRPALKCSGGALTQSTAVGGVTCMRLCCNCSYQGTTTRQHQNSLCLKLLIHNGQLCSQHLWKLSEIKNFSPRQFLLQT